MLDFSRRAFLSTAAAAGAILTISAARAKAATSLGLVSGGTAAVVGATDPVPHLRLWRDALGYEVRAHGEIDAATASHIYDVDHAIESWALGAPGADGGLVHIFRLPATAQQTAASPFRESGPHSLDLRVRDLVKAEAQLNAKGLGFRERPRRMVLDLGSHTMVITEVAFRDPPDGSYVQFAHIDGIEPSPAWEHSAEAIFSELTSLLVTVVDPDSEAAFWQALGLDVVGDSVVTNKHLDFWLGLPDRTNVRLVSIAGASLAAIELVGLPKSIIRCGPDRHIGRAIGIAGCSVRTHDLAGALKAISKHGRIERCPCAVTTPVHGRAELANVRTPGGIAIELWQPS